MKVCSTTLNYAEKRPQTVCLCVKIMCDNVDDHDDDDDDEDEDDDAENDNVANDDVDR